MSETESSYCNVCQYNHSIGEIDWDLAGNPHCDNCGEILVVPPDEWKEDVW